MGSRPCSYRILIELETTLASLSYYNTKSDDELVREIANRRITGFDQLMELFSTHPNIVKRIRALNELT